MLERTCKITKRSFQITKEEQEAYDHFALPYPEACREERLRQALCFLNERRLFWRTCSVTGQRIVSIYPETAPFPVVTTEVVQQLQAGNLRYGRDYDLRAPFFDQLYDVWRAVPRAATSAEQTVKSSAVHLTLFANHATLVSHSFYIDDCLYSLHLVDCKHCIDCLHCSRLTRSYQCVDCHDGALLRYSTHSSGCSDSWFLYDSRNCRHCLCCVGLQDKKFCIFNAPVSEHEYWETLRTWNLDNRSACEDVRDRFAAFVREHARNKFFTDNPGSGSGNSLYRSSRIVHSYNCQDSAGLIDCYALFRADGCVQGVGFGDGLEDSAQFISVGLGASRVVNCIECYDGVSDLSYSIGCKRSSHLFGCVGLVDREYCILNRQYSRSRYADLTGAIRRQLVTDGSWGRFFNLFFTPFAYNQSAAGDYMPLGEIQATYLGYGWAVEDEELRPSELLRAVDAAGGEIGEMPLAFSDRAIETLPQQIYVCELMGKPFQLSPREITLYLELGVCPPARSFEQRHKERLSYVALAQS